MTNYSEIEIQTAKNLLEHGYKWIARNRSGKLRAYYSKPSNRGRIWLSDDDAYGYYFCEFVPIFHNISIEDSEPTSLESIVHPQILDDAERKYLSAVISPFRDRVKHICRGWYITSSGEYQRNLSIYITLSDDVTSYNIDLPFFKKETMYKGMEIGKAYTLEELGL